MLHQPKLLRVRVRVHAGSQAGSLRCLPSPLPHLLHTAAVEHG